ncbi:MAG: hypothetical protein ACYTGB_15765 [Planctomycetota bacterium]
MRTMLLLSSLLLTAIMAGTAPAGEDPAAAGPPASQAIAKAEANKWLKLHEQKEGDAVRFKRQAHGGSCFDSKRGQLILFGSNTHGRDWCNSPLFFDVAKCEWRRAYPDDPKETYKVNDEGLPVAGEKGDHPWAMHTFGAVIYDPGRDEMVICCYPGHMTPGRFSNALKHVWGKVKRHPTWTYSLAGGKWTPLPGKAAHFFPNAAAWDSDAKRIVGYGGRGIWELSGEPRAWKKLPGRSMFGWHNNMAYDSKNKAMVVFGTNKNSNEIVVYNATAEDHKKMPAAGKRPAEDQHNPMCFDPKAGATVIVVDRVEGDRKDRSAPRKAETWLYDLGADAWTQLPAATLPFGCGMNYTMDYDPGNGACILVEQQRGKPTTVWALKVDRAALKN